MIGAVSRCSSSRRAAVRLASSTLARVPSSSSSSPTSKKLIVRCLAMKSREVPASAWEEELPPQYTLESVPPPSAEYWEPPGEPEPDPSALQRKPVSSAHLVDVAKGTLSARDSAAIGPSGTVVHGRFGELPPEATRGIPLEFLALLHPAAEGAAALRMVSEASGGGKKGTLLVYGASHPAALSAVQLATAAGYAVVAVVGSDASGDDDMMDVIKGLTAEPGTAVPAEYALVKKNFADLVQATVEGKDAATSTEADAEAMLSDFKANVLEYCKAFPDTLPAAVSRDLLTLPVLDKDRETYRDNMDTYLTQFPSGAPPIQPQLLDAYFTPQHYAHWKARFGIQSTAVISADEETMVDDFNPAAMVEEMLDQGYALEDTSGALVTESPNADVEFTPYNFNVLKADGETKMAAGPAGPIVGAIVALSPDLSAAAEAIHKASASGKKRDMAEALVFLTEAQRTEYSAASSVTGLASQAGVPIFTVGGSLPDMTAAQPTDEDVQAALAAMNIPEDGVPQAPLNYFVQTYRACDYPVYADYAIHRASEDLAGPRQIVVAK